MLLPNHLEVLREIARASDDTTPEWSDAAEQAIAELDRLGKRCAWQSKVVGILRALLDRNTPVKEFKRLVAEFLVSRQEQE